MDDSNGQETSHGMLSFHTRHQYPQLASRVGELVFKSRPAIHTPALVACTSRGVIPHVTPDLVQKHTSISVVYAGLEDFLEKSRQNPPILKIPEDAAVKDSTLRAYTCLPDRCVSILGPRRVPRINTPHQSTGTSLSISTSFGFANLEVTDYNRATWRLNPECSVTAVDLVQEDKISRKRIEKSADRTHAWLRDTLGEVEKLKINPALFASIPPLQPEQQSFYLSDLADEFKHNLSGICVYEPASAALVPESLQKLPVICLSHPQGPHDILKTISLGVDLVSTPFVTDITEAGIALSFSFQPPGGVEDEPLGIDMWSTSHTSDISALTPSCSCYSCTRHHRAYLHHLLQAKEMLAWTLLQIHNFHVMDKFFEDIRKSISNGTFEEDSRAFRSAYQTEMPEKTGQGPRVRGYQIRSMGPGEPKKNEKRYNKFDEQTLKLEEAESGVATPTPDEDAEVLQSHGMGQKTTEL